MPLYNCPNCYAKVRVADEQTGRVLRCPKCRGRFMADPALPSDVQVEEYADEPPPVQGLADVPADVAPPVRRRCAFEDEPPPDRHSGGWLLCAVWFAAEFAFGFIAAWWLSRSTPFYDSTDQTLAALLRILGPCILRFRVAGMFYIAGAGRRLRDGIAAWIILLLLVGSIGLALFLFNRPDPDGACGRHA
jgi:predicted Zn finger-like uncharacterized protein